MITKDTCKFCGLVFENNDYGIEIKISEQSKYMICHWCDEYMPIYLNLTGKTAFEEIGLTDWLNEIIGLGGISCAECCSYNWFIEYDTMDDLLRLRCDICGFVKIMSLTKIILLHSKSYLYKKGDDDDGAN